MKLMLDHQEFKCKPSEKETIEVNNRITQFQTDITPELLSEELIKGKTFVPALLNKKIKGRTRRAKEYWTSQEIMCIDFDNETEVSNPDYPHNSNKKKIKIKDVTITIEDALETFKNDAMFIYTSFSHTTEHPKFRVVFAFEEEITDPYDVDNTLEHYKKQYPNADQKCFERARMFYGGKSLYSLNYKNRIPIYKTKKHTTEGLRDYDSIKVLGSSLDYRSHQYPHHSNNIELIRDKNVNKLKGILNKDMSLFYTYAESVDYIKRQDIGELLGLNISCLCPFHNDQTPSARIFRNEFTNHSLIHCHSDNCDFNTGTIIKVIEKLTQLNKVQSLRFLRDVYNIDFQHTDWQREQIELIDENIRYLQSGDFEIEYPKQYKIMKRYIPDLIQFLILSKEYLPPEHYTDEQTKVLFFASLEHFARFMGKSESSKKRLGDKIALFAYFSYIYKLKEVEIPEILLERAKFELVKNKFSGNHMSYNLMSFYEIPSYSVEIMSFAEQKAEEYSDNHFTMRGWSYEMLLRALGEDEALRVYPQMSGKKIKERSHILTKEMESAALEILNVRDWVTEKEIINVIKSYIDGVSQTALERQIKKIISELIQKYDLKRVQSNKEVFKNLGVSPPVTENGFMSFPFILIKNQRRDEIK